MYIYPRTHSRTRPREFAQETRRSERCGLSSSAAEIGMHAEMCERDRPWMFANGENAALDSACASQRMQAPIRALLHTRLMQRRPRGRQ